MHAQVAYAQGGAKSNNAKTERRERTPMFVLRKVGLPRVSPRVGEARLLLEAQAVIDGAEDWRLGLADEARGISVRAPSSPSSQV